MLIRELYKLTGFNPSFLGKPLSYEKREAVKNQGYMLMRCENSSLYKKTYGVLNIALGHFYRSKQTAKHEGRKHPSFNVYMSHWLISVAHIVESFEVLELLKATFTPIKTSRIVPLWTGTSYL